MASNKDNSVVSKLSLKLLIDTTAQKVLFAEAGKEVVDFLFGLLSLPVGSVVKLLSKDRMEGSIGNLYKSIQELDDSYLQNSKGKSTLLNPIHSISPSLLLPGPSSSSCKNVYFQCVNRIYSGCYECVSKVNGALCPHCKNKMSKQMTYVEGDEKDDDVDPNVGFVKGVVTYTIMDDLTVTPMSSISSITLLSKFNLKNLNALVERDVTLGFNEALEVLEISLRSKKVLTSVFLGKK
ncbi:uncharacterized protein LOC122038219 [Zingiber officinale]|uniref:DUF674 domain-containing protein n=1 Tax=Zingiber officinale TaxID=94328 RepID=A0A8J5I6F9_ZINOF|nr:uncharacterized protein LOC121982803 [Zingiber officinale]XP_042391803.1 uncharacterized protein LOC121982803 [Zingiber officinale]XP_042453795.1 uncharacterized protein LOC122038219 [Zingiber officinale]XP_042453796.1 uncharacterized protein LOC122038219 [Zingiber officinale]KAG6538296.1 hypothetical protein ZIOFF_003411 [Zingiber officinale]